MDKEHTGIQIRVPAVANFMIDSTDRPAGSAWDFAITKAQNLANGFFTRIGATEVILEWFRPNIDNEDTLYFTLTSGTYPVIMNGASINGIYMTVAAVLAECVTQLNTAIGGTTISIVEEFGEYGLFTSTGDFISVDGTLAAKMNFQPGGTPFIFPDGPDLRKYRFLDFLSNDLTYHQNVKDSMTSILENNVLLRWYMAYDNPTANGEYGFPILMGYEPFVLRRLYSPAKQIKWESNMPVGNVAFRVLGTLNKPLANETSPQVVTGPGNWLMTLQLSED